MPVIVAAKEPALRVRDLEDRALDGNPQIGALDQHEAAAHGKAVDRGDDRLFEGTGHERILEVGPLAARLTRRQRLLHIFAGAEATTGSGEDRDFELAVVA